MAPHELSRADARRICIQAQLLAEPRPDDLLEVVRHLTVLQAEPTAPLGAPSADLVLWSRLGSAYDRAELADLIDQQVLDRPPGLLQAERGPRAVPRRDVDLARSRAAEGVATRHRRVDRDERRVPAGDPRRAAARGATADQRVRGQLRGAVAVVGVEQQQERPDAAEADGRPRRGRGGRPRGTPEAVGPRRADLPRRPGPRPRQGVGDAQRAAAEGARAGAGAVHRAARRGARRRRRRRTRGRRGGQGRVAGGADAAGRAVRGPRRTALAVRPAGAGPQAARPALRVRLPAGDVQARRAADLGLLRAARSSTTTGWSGSSTPPPSPTEGVLRVDAVHEDEPWPDETRAAVAAEIEDLARWLDLEVMRVG